MSDNRPTRYVCVAKGHRLSDKYGDSCEWSLVHDEDEELCRGEFYELVPVAESCEGR
jgi:hypothetical protein